MISHYRTKHEGAKADLVREKIKEPVQEMAEPDHPQQQPQAEASDPALSCNVWNPDAAALPFNCHGSPWAPSPVSSPSTMISGADSFDHSPMMPIDDFDGGQGFGDYTG